MKTRQIPINSDGQVSKTILAGYWKYGGETFVGKSYGTTGTAIKVIYEEGKEISD